MSEPWPCVPELDVVQELIETLPRLTTIEYLQLVEAEETLDLHPALLLAFGSLTTLRHVNLTGVNASSALLSRLHSPLISTSISFLSDDDLELCDYLADDE